MEELAVRIWSALFPASIVGVVIALILGTLFRKWLDGVTDKNSRLETRVNELENTRLVRLESSLEKHIEEDSSAEIATELRFINGNLNKLNDKVDGFTEKTAEHGAKIEANEKYIKNLDESFQRHKGAKHAN